MSMTHVVGIDPGLVDTGVVRMLFRPTSKTYSVQATVLTNACAMDVETQVMKYLDLPTPLIVVEDYIPRTKLRTDARMTQLLNDLRRELPRHTQFLANHGVKKVVTQQLMELLDVWTFPIQTNHQDLRSAARIALLGMLKSDHHNELLADIVLDHMGGERWTKITGGFTP